MYFVSSSIVECMALIPRAIDFLMEQMAKGLKEWAALPGNSMPHSGRFCKQRIGLTSMQVLPEARWSKFDDARVYIGFLHRWLERREDQSIQDQCFHGPLLACRQTECSSALQLRPEVGTFGRVFVKIYAELPHLCLEGRRPRMGSTGRFDQGFEMGPTRCLAAGLQHGLEIRQWLEMRRQPELGEGLERRLLPGLGDRLQKAAGRALLRRAGGARAARALAKAETDVREDTAFTWTATMWTRRGGAADWTRTSACSDSWRWATVC